MKWNKLLHLNVETTALDPEVANVIEIAYTKEVGGATDSIIHSFKVQPVLHSEDQLYCHKTPETFCAEYNHKLHTADPKRLKLFSFPDNPPLFTYNQAAAAYNSDSVDPSSWLLAKGSISAKRALNRLITYLENEGLETPSERWVLIGHNVKWDLEVLTFWAKRVLGEEEAERLLLSKINRFAMLDTVHLAQWFQYAEKLTCPTSKLHDIAKALHLGTERLPKAANDIRLVQSIVWELLKNQGWTIPF